MLTRKYKMFSQCVFLVLEKPIFLLLINASHIIISKCSRLPFGLSVWVIVAMSSLHEIGDVLNNTLSDKLSVTSYAYVVIVCYKTEQPPKAIARGILGIIKDR